MKVLNFGSLNLDHVYTVPRFVKPGETLAALSHTVKLGGKGLNQTIALKRAGAQVCHAGCVGAGGERLRAYLEQNGADISFLETVEEMQGHTVIQVDPGGENCILLYGGSNLCVTEEQIRRTLACFGKGDWLLLQNEINLLPRIVEEADARGLRIVLNPSPYRPELKETDFSRLAWLLVNEIEAEQITGERDPDRAFAWLHGRYPRLSLLCTLGEKGSIAFCPEEGGTQRIFQEAFRAEAVDTTGAGDTYTGYFLAGLTGGMPLRACMERASRAAAISVGRPGAAESIPMPEEVDG